MAERWAVKNGNWSDTTVWDGGTLPGVGDDVHANTYTVTINGDYTCVALHTDAGATAAAGGLFQTSGAISITANTTAGAVKCLNVNSDGVQVGNSTGGSAGSAYGTYIAGGGIQTGNSTGGSASTSDGTYIVFGGIQNGNSTGGSVSNARGTWVASGGIQNGNSTGGSASGAYGTYCYEGGIQNGNATGGSSDAHGTFLDFASWIFCPVATGTVNGAFGVYTYANRGTHAYIRSESGDYPKSLGAGTDTTLDNWPFAWLFSGFSLVGPSALISK